MVSLEAVSFFPLPTIVEKENKKKDKNYELLKLFEKQF